MIATMISPIRMIEFLSMIAPHFIILLVEVAADHIRSTRSSYLS
jgi:hypothetical protein